MLRPIGELGREAACRVQALLFDLDDTFTTGGKIPACAFSALWALRKAGLRLILVTGRPAGWCDHIARMWPVDGVVGENGALCFWFDEQERRLHKHFLDSDSVRAEKRRRLQALQKAILTAVPGCAVASDQRYRESDLAIDYCEDVPPLGPEAVAAICRIFAEHGATCKVSSIHVNGWFGDYDKLGMVRQFVGMRFGLELDQVKDTFVYCGDSPNDEPMFRYFPVSVAVRNIERFLGQIRHRPRYLTSAAGGDGFAELAGHLLAGRGGHFCPETQESP